MLKAKDNKASKEAAKASDKPAPKKPLAAPAVSKAPIIKRVDN